MSEGTDAMSGDSKCPLCGNPVEQRASFCSCCGAALHPDQLKPIQSFTMPAHQSVVHHVISEAPKRRKGGMSACAWVGVITLSLTAVIVIVSFVGCVSCVSLFTTGANQVSKEMELANDKAVHPEKYTVKESGVEVLSAKVVKESYSSSLRITVKNNSGKTLKSVVVTVKTGTEYGDSTFGDQNNCDVVDPERPLKNGGTRTGSFIHIGNKYVIESSVTRVMYEDGTVWPDDYFSKST